jgi:cytochrome c-type biogenesis protein CcmH
MLFEFLLAVLLLIALAMIAPALLKTRHLDELDRSSQNVEIARERLDEIAAEHASGEMTDEVFTQVRSELEASLIEDVSQQVKPAESQASAPGTGKYAMLTLVVLVPLAAIALYSHLGSPQYLGYQGANAGTVAGMQHMAANASSMTDVVEKLEKQLESNPDDGNAWFMLARTYMATDVYDKALAALEKAHAIFGDEPAILLGMADASAMLSEGDLTGQPTEYIEKALQLDPTNTTGLWLGGMSAQQNGNFALAVERWLRLMPLVRDEAESLDQLKNLITVALDQANAAGITVDVEKMIAQIQSEQPEHVQQAASTQPVASAAAEEQQPAVSGLPSIKAWVALDDAVKDRVSPTDTLFVFAKAETGPPMPLAAYRGTVADLPLEITLDDSMAMMPQMKLSGFQRVKVSARIAKGGTPTVQPGDITSPEQVIDLDGTVAVELTLSQVIE